MSQQMTHLTNVSVSLWFMRWRILRILRIFKVQDEITSFTWLSPLRVESRWKPKYRHSSAIRMHSWFRNKPCMTYWDNFLGCKSRTSVFSLFSYSCCEFIKVCISPSRWGIFTHIEVYCIFSINCSLPFESSA